ncbi:glycoprotein [Amycolatopsis deserti]|uniref:Glycoprotein n=2 Tax=Amycolatopsis deserti TaxID=185696 RepID=A0ABQ3J9D2_9PSEU|nr:glycoprotein [Amycolatopsis deserti]
MFVPVTASAQTEAPSRLRLDVTQLNPRVITTNSVTLNVTGTVTNVGDRRISDLQVRLELGERLTTERQVRTAMSGAAAAAASSTDWVDVEPATLEPGESAQLSVTVRLDGTRGNLRVNSAGLYPLLVNVNGTPAYGGAARLASMSMLLPVLSAPGKSVTGQNTSPAPFTMLWPIADTRPRIVAAPLGGTAVLSDDVLAAELRPGGRLYGLVESASAVRDDPQVSRALCYAIDPDLLDTVDAMSRGYQVRTATGTVGGTGAEAAKAWLGSLRELVTGQCLVQLPYADADLTALTKVRGGDLLPFALDTGARVQELLGVTPQNGVLWADGALDQSTLAALSGARVRTLITDPVDSSTGSQSAGAVTLDGTTLRAQQVDSLVLSGLAGTSGSTEVTTATPVDDPDIATQNGLAALAFRGGLAGGTSRPVLVAPPRRWTATQDELTGFLRNVGDFVDRNMLTPQSLPALLATASTGSARMSYDSEDLATATPASVTDEMSSIETTMTDLQGAMQIDPAAQVEPAELLEPLRFALVRSTSGAWRAQRGAADAAAADARTELDNLLGRVTVDTPPVPISMASGSAPLPVSFDNRLPVQIAVRIQLNNTPGLRVEQVPDRLLPAGLAGSERIPAEALRAGVFNVTVSLTTPGGTPLGQPARFELRSNEYGVVTLVLTIAGAAALVLLSARQIYRRVRARKA